MAEIRIDLLGDVQINRESPESALAELAPAMAEADLRLCQLEATMTGKGKVRPDVQNPAHRVPPRMVEGLTAAGVDAVTFAGNNNVDYGPEAMFDTVERLGREGIDAVGVGEDVADAREPLYLDVGDATVAVVNACSILRSGYAATERRPGLAPLRISTFYETLENVYEQPGTPARTVTVPDRGDLLAFCARIEEAAERADYVLACHHGGVHFTYDVATYQPDVAYAAVEAGADAVIDTHAHNLSAIDVHRGKPIFYSLGNAVFDQPEEIATEGVSKYLQFYGMSTESGAEDYPHPRHTRDTMIVHLSLSPEGVEFEITPAWIDPTATPVPVDWDDEAGRRVVDLLSALSAEVGTDLEYADGRIRLAGHDGTDARTWVSERAGSYPWLSKLQVAEYGPLETSIADVL